jgi:hypothetical protein
LVLISAFKAVWSAHLPHKCAVSLLKDVTITKRQARLASLNEKLGKHHETAYWHPWNLAWFKTDCAMLLGPEIKNMH